MGKLFIKHAALLFWTQDKQTLEKKCELTLVTSDSRNSVTKFVREIISFIAPITSYLASQRNNNNIWNNFYFYYLLC